MNWLPGRDRPFARYLNGVALFDFAAAFASGVVVPSTAERESSPAFVGESPFVPPDLFAGCSRRIHRHFEPWGQNGQYGRITRQRSGVSFLNTTTTRAWLALMLSGVFEVGWIVSLKALTGLNRGLPLVGYLLFGLGASVSLSFAMRTIPMATAYSVWVGVSVVGALAIDVAVFRQPWSAFRGACAMLIVAGACGLRLAPLR